MSEQPNDRPKGWPGSVEYMSAPRHSRYLVQDRILRPKESLLAEPGLQMVKLPISPSSSVNIRAIGNESHPAYRELGLFATGHLAPDAFIVLYLGLVHTNDPHDTDETSNYDLSIDRDAGISVDASKMGTEARFINDYRGVREQGPNAEFRDVLMEYEHGTVENGIGVFVLSAGKAGKRKAGIRLDEEIVVSYGKGFWQERRMEV